MALILVIEDDQAMRKVIVSALKTAGHTVTEAENGQAGLSLLSVYQPDVVVTDVLMPEKDGIETIRDIRAGKHNVKILAISGGGRLANAAFLNTAKEFGADLVLQKPFLVRGLVDAVARLIAQG